MSKTCIVSAGAVTGLGFDLPATVAAMNAKLDNFKETQFFDSTNENLIGSYIFSNILSDDFPSHGVAKVRLLLKRAVLESLSGIIDLSINKNAVELLYKKWSVIFVLSEEHTNQVAQLIELLKSIPNISIKSFCEISIGSSGTGIAINSAKKILDENQADAVMIVSMDTWLEPFLISQGNKKNRLLSLDNEVGCIPAEAAVALILSNKMIDKQSQVLIDGVGIGQEPVLLTNADVSTMGRGLRDAYRQALQTAGIKMTDLHLRIGDVTGEDYFFQESINGFGAVIEGIMPKDYVAILTSSYLGDMRSASGVYSLAYIWQLAQNGQFNNKYALSHMSSPTHSDRAVVVINVGDYIENNIIISDTILPHVIQQHIEEASLYWLRQQDSICQPTMTQDDLNRFRSLMYAQLYGLLIAGSDGLEMALNQLERWQTADEAFVAMYAYLNSKNPDEQKFKRIQAVLDQDINIYQGATAAILESEPSLSEFLVELWWHQGNLEQRTALLPVLNQYSQIDLHDSILYALKSAYTPLRKQAIKLVGETKLKKYKSELYLAFEYEHNISCKLEAACSLALLKEYDSINSFQPYNIIDAQLDLRVLMIWSYLVCDEVFEQWIESAKQNNDIWPLLWSILFRSNTKYLNEVIDLLKNDETHKFSRFSGYVIEHLTGVNIDTLNLWVKEEMLNDVVEEDIILSDESLPSNYWAHNQQYDIVQSGLLYPNVDALLNKLETLDILPNCQVINGQPLSTLYEDCSKTLTLPKMWILNLYNTLNFK